MLIQAAINGSLAKVEHPHIPLTSAELATAAAEAATAGAGAIHFHARAEDLFLKDVRTVDEFAFPGIIAAGLRP